MRLFRELPPGPSRKAPCPAGAWQEGAPRSGSIPLPNALAEKKGRHAMRYITLTSIAPPWWTAPEGATNEELVQLAMRNWREEINRVLPEKPDLILLPEVCDRFAGQTPAQNRAYYDVRGDRMRDFFAGIARENRCYIAYSAVRRAEDGFFRNSTQLIGRTGAVEGIYNQNHLVVSEGPLDGPLPMRCGRDAVVSGLDFGGWDAPFAST